MGLHPLMFMDAIPAIISCTDLPIESQEAFSLLLEDQMEGYALKARLNQLYCWP